MSIFGTEPEEVRSLTLYSISPEGLVPKITLPARVLFGGSRRQLMPDGTKYYVEYLREQNCYQVVRLRYSLKDLRLPEPPAATQPLVDYRVQILQLKPLGAKALTLSPDHFLTTGADGQTKRVPVVMRKQVFELRSIIEDGESSNEWSGQAWCYEFRSGDPEVPHSYSFWMPDAPQREGVGCWPPDELQFFSLENGDKFLGLSGDYGVLLMNVSEPNNNITALKEYLVSVQEAPLLSWSISEVAMSGGTFGRGAEQWRPVPVTQLFGSWPFAYAVGPHHITIEDVSRNEAGHLVVSVSGIKSDRVYTLVFDGKQWRVE